MVALPLCASWQGMARIPARHVGTHVPEGPCPHGPEAAMEVPFIPGLWGHRPSGFLGYKVEPLPPLIRATRRLGGRFLLFLFLFFLEASVVEVAEVGLNVVCVAVHVG